MRKFLTLQSNNLAQFKKNLLVACSNYQTAVVLDSQGYSDHKRWFAEDVNFELLAALDKIDISCHTFDQLQQFAKNNKDWLFGYISYDAKNSIETSLTSTNIDRIGFDELFFFVPRYVIIIESETIKIGFSPAHNCENDALHIFNLLENEQDISEFKNQETTINQSVTKESYKKNIAAIIDQIHRGNIYEMNYCIEFYAHRIKLKPELAFLKLVNLSPTPFSAFVKHNHNYLLSASPERYIKRWVERVISQPIKGTIKRGIDNSNDEELKNLLRQNLKEQAENIMITDLVRNDLSKVAERGSVKVEELMGIYSFPQVHQLISTISARVSKDKNWFDIIKATFPMGSMTGAPKLRAMELIDKFEITKRGLYSGTVGYITPDGDFDFNVVIRSLLYNDIDENISFMVGSAITANSNAEQEYDECLLKASALLKVFNAKL